MAKRVSTRRVKKDRLYTYDEASELLGITSGTVRSWRSSGLSVMTASTPHYILGAELIAYVEKRQRKRSVKSCLDKIYCFTCKDHRKPLGSMIDYIPITATRGRLMGLCETCEGQLNRFAAKADLGKFTGIYDIAIKNLS
jgi:hypothetical protein